MSEIQPDPDVLPPWQQSLRTTAAETIAAGRLGQAVLFTATPGAGVGRLAASVAGALICRTPDTAGYACGQCQSCRLFLAGTHPDLARLTPAEAGGDIKVDQVRAFAETMRLTPHYPNGRIGWIEPLDRLNRSAANSALKILEEPPSSSVILAVTERPSAILPTIASRFTIWRLPPPTPETGRAWLGSQGADAAALDDDSLRTPLSTAERMQDEYSRWVDRWDADLARLLAGRASVSGVAERAQEAPPAIWLDWLYRRVNAILMHRLGVTDDASLPERLAASIAVGDLIQWQALAARVTEAARFRYSNADWQLVMESVLLKLEVMARQTTNSQWPNRI